MSKLGLKQKILVKLGIPIFTEYKTNPHWKGELPFFVFYCPVHGFVENYKQGYDHKLNCPDCFDEGIKTKYSPLKNLIFCLIISYLVAFTIVFFIKMFIGGS